MHGFVAGIVMLDSETPRIPGDPGHAGTFKFPVCYATAHGFGVDDMLEYRPERLGPAFAAVRELEQAGVEFVAADCGLFSIYQRDLAAAGEVPFLGSALSLVPFVAQSLSPRSAVGIVTGHTDYLREAHLAAVGVDPARVVVAGMEECSEFCRVVIDGGGGLDVEAPHVRLPLPSTQRSGWHIVRVRATIRVTRGREGRGSRDTREG